MSENDSEVDDLQFADNERLQHEISYLRGRMTNLEVFKRMFFTLQEDLVEERRKSSELISTLQKQVATQGGLQLDTEAVTTADSTEPNIKEENALSNSDESNIEDESDLLDSIESDIDDESTLVKNDKNVESLNHQLETLNHLSMLLMDTASEYMEIIDFFRDCNVAENYKDMVDLLFIAVENYECNISLELRCREGELIFSKNDSFKDQHTSSIKRLKIQGRIIEEDNLLCINHENITLLITHFPKEDERVYGRFKENLLLLASGTNSVVQALDGKVKLKTERLNLYKVVKGTHHAMDKIKHGIGEQIRKTNTVQNSFVEEVSIAVEKFGLSDAEKLKITQLLADGKKNLSKVLMESFVLDESFLKVITKLEKTYSVVDDTSAPDKANKTADQSIKYT